MIYLNNAATSYPKPNCVLEAFDACVKKPPFSQFRSTASFDQPDILEECRKNLGRLFKIAETGRIFFTSGATEAMNMVIGGLPIGNKRIVTTQTEHNCVLRTLYNHPDFAGKGRAVIAPCGPNGKVDTDVLEKMITADTGALIVNHCSNVTGMVQEMGQISRIAKAHSLLLVVDASQSAGCIPIDADGWGADALVFTGHKSLFGVQGTGGFYIRSRVKLRPEKFGGTGRNSAQLTYPDGDYEYEVGTQNSPGISALNAGVCYILNVRLQKIMERERNLLKRLYQGLDRIPSVVTYGTYEENKGPVVSFNVKGLAPSDVAYILNGEYGIVVRTGLHCSPLIHKALGTEKNGTVRISISYLTADGDIDAFLKAISKIGGMAGQSC